MTRTDTASPHAARAADLLDHLDGRTTYLLARGHDVRALPAEARAVLETAAKGEAVEMRRLGLADAAADRLTYELDWEFLFSLRDDSFDQDENDRILAAILDEP